MKIKTRKMRRVNCAVWLILGGILLGFVQLEEYLNSSPMQETITKFASLYTTVPGFLRDSLLIQADISRKISSRNKCRRR